MLGGLRPSVRWRLVPRRAPPAAHINLRRPASPSCLLAWVAIKVIWEGCREYPTARGPAEDQRRRSLPAAARGQLERTPAAVWRGERALCGERAAAASVMVRMGASSAARTLQVPSHRWGVGGRPGEGSRARSASPADMDSADMVSLPTSLLPCCCSLPLLLPNTFPLGHLAPLASLLCCGGLPGTSSGCVHVRTCPQGRQPMERAAGCWLMLLLLRVGRGAGQGEAWWGDSG